MLNNNLITVVVYLNNEEQYIARVTNTILNSTYKELEIIAIIDNASDDNRLSLIKELLKTDNRLKLIEQKDKVGLGKAYNLAIAQAKGEYIFFVGASDTLPDNAIEKLYTSIKDRQSDVVIGAISFYNEQSSLFEKNDSLAYTSLKIYNNRLIPLSNLHYNIESINNIIYGKLYKTNFLRENKVLFSEINGYENIRFWYTLLFVKSLKCVFLDDEAYTYHSYPHKVENFNIVDMFTCYEEIKQLAQDNKDEIFLYNTKIYLVRSYERFISKRVNYLIPLDFFAVARKYFFSGELDTLIKKENLIEIGLLKKSHLLAYYWTGLDKGVIRRIINSNALSRKFFKIIKATFN